VAISKQEEKALFRFNIIFPLIDANLTRGERSDSIRKICAKEYKIPNSTKKTISPATVWNWYHTYLKHGTIDSLAPAGRSDRGVRRSLSPDTQKELIRRYRENPKQSIKHLVKKAREEGVFTSEDTMGMSGIYQLLNKESKGFEPAQSDRRAYRAPAINDMWQSDALHGPKVVFPNGKRGTAKLFCCLDNKSRLICYAKWYSAENTECLLDCLWNAFRLRGLPKIIYTDNGSCYRDERLRLGCAALGVKISYSRPYRPEGKGAVLHAA
jgi:putative transposase